MKKRLKVLLSLLLVLAMCVSLLPGIALAEDDETPTEPAIPVVGKNVVANTDSNGDPNGTYTITLQITGDADPVSQGKTGNVNVIIVYDISQSMTTLVSDDDPTTTDYSRADYAEDVVYNFIAKLKTYQDEANPNNVEVALVTFGPNASIAQTWTTDLTNGTDGINRFFDQDVDGTVTSTHNYGSNYGTNWNWALERANSLLTTLNNREDKDPTFVILVTDGVCTKSITQNGQGDAPTGNPWTYYRQYLTPALTQASSIEGRDNTTLYGIYAYGTEADLLDDLVYYANNESHRTKEYNGTELSLTEVPNNNTDANNYNFGATDPTDNYFNAGSTDQLNAAIDSIFEDVIAMIGIANSSMDDEVSIKDPETGMAIMDLVTVIPNTFKYYRAGGKNADNTEKYDHNANGGLGVEWENPPEDSQAKDNNGSVVWNIAGVLEDDVVYSLTFECATSQDALDLVAELKNGTKTIADLPEDLQDYVFDDGEGNYSIKTNGDLTVTYEDTRFPDAEIEPYKPDLNIKPVPLEATQITIEKTWVGQYQEEEEAPKITIGIKSDDPEASEDSFELAFASGTHTGQRYISTGVMTVDGAGNVTTAVTGHDFELTEKVEGSNLSYHWELHAETMHPMLKNGSIVMLVKVKDETEVPEGVSTTKTVTKNGVAYYQIGTSFYKESSSSASLTATNYRRSTLNLKKVVNGEAPKGDEFTFSMKLTAPSTASDEDKEFWFAVQDEEGEYIPGGELTVTGATRETKTLKSNNPKLTKIPVYDSEKGTYTYTYDGKEYTVDAADGGTPTTETVDEQTITIWSYYTDYYYFASDASVTVGMQDGWNLRFTNVLTGTTYEFEETVLPDLYALVAKDPITLSRDEDGTDVIYPATEADDDNDETDPPADMPTVTGAKISGKVTELNKDYQVTYTNEYNASTVVVVKTFGGIITGDKVPTGFTATVTYDATDAFTGETPPSSVTLSIPAQAADDQTGGETGGNQQPAESVNREGGDTTTTDAIVPEITNNGLTYTWTIDRVPVGLNVTVTESGTDVDGLALIPADDATNPSVITATTKGEGDLADTPTEKGKTTTLNLKNNYKEATGFITITKKVPVLDSISGTMNRAGFSFTVKDASGKVVNNAQQEFTVDTARPVDGYWIVTTDPIEVPVGTYTVTENEFALTGVMADYTLTTEYAPVATTATDDTGDDQTGNNTNLNDNSNGNGTEVDNSTTDEAPTCATVTVTIEDTADQPKEVTVTNTFAPKPGEITVVKEFTGDITKDKVPTGLTITVEGQGTDGKTYTLKTTEETNNEDDPNAGSGAAAETDDIKLTVSEDGLTYTWVISNVPVDDYEITESGERVEGYNVKTTYKPVKPVEETEEQIVSNDKRDATDGSENTEAAKSAYVTIKANGKETATITNEYTVIPGTLKVIKIFAGDDFTKDNVPKGLTITAKGENTGKTYTFKTTDTEGLEVSEDGLTYTWTNDKVAPDTYTVKESGETVSGFTVETEYEPQEEEDLEAQEQGYEEAAAENDDDEEEEMKAKTESETEEKPAYARVIVEAEKEKTATITNTYTKKESTPSNPPELNYVDHYGYMVGYPDGTVRPAGNITRAEVATIFFRLLTDESRKELWCTENDFSDVSSDQWFNNAVSTLANAGILSGYPDGTFKPGNNITRAELATIVARFLQDRISAGVEVNLSDISGHWAEGFIIQVAENGIITGYPDGTFKPDQAITRAETVTMVNRLLQRKPDKDHLLDDMIVWPDNQDTETWFYAAIQEATNSHSYYLSNYFECEVWFDLLEMRDWAALEKEWADWNSGTQIPGDPMPNAPQLNP
ncbi:MAG: S-layer homology domain-containing protein [Oscillospiraceae bacterium]|nr:S-layer homology domain-containing protein [Oscillospiraceae bacterium]